MRKISTLAVMLALLAAPVAMAGEGKGCCAKKGAQTAEGKKCSPADCKKSDKCTADEKAKCAAHTDAKAEAPKAPAAPKS